MALSDDIQKLYIAYFNRPADPIDLAYWIDQANRNGGNGTDTLNIGSTTTQATNLSTKVSNIEVINVAGSTGTASFTNADGAGVTLNYTKSTGDNTITLGSAGQTLNLLGASFSSTTITGGAAVDVINLQASGSGSETLIETGANMSNRNQVDIVGNFNATGTDYFKTGVNATTVGRLLSAMPTSAIT